MTLRSVDYVGQQFGRLTVINMVWKTEHNGTRMQVCRCVCSCGTKRRVDPRDLKIGATVSCGCRMREAPITHNRCYSGTYNSWRAMIERCTNRRHSTYERYGARGIIVCERWRQFSSFLADMGDRPVGRSLDRYPDNAGNYEPGNCRWATPKQQAKNCKPRRRKNGDR
jgi:hypothetical protein